MAMFMVFYVHLQIAFSNEYYYTGRGMRIYKQIELMTILRILVINIIALCL